MTIILRFQCDILEKYWHLKGKKATQWCWRCCPPDWTTSSYLMRKTNECHFQSVKSCTLSPLRLLPWRPMKPWCVTRQWCSCSCKLWLNHRVMSSGRLLLVLPSGARRYEWRLPFDHLIIPHWSKTSVSCWYWFTSNRFMTAIKAQLGSSLTILVSTCSCLILIWRNNISRCGVWVLADITGIVFSASSH